MSGKQEKHLKITPETQQLIDGLLISDAYIRPWKKYTTARLCIGQTIRHKPWIKDIQTQLNKSNIKHLTGERMQIVHLPQDPIGVKKQFKRIDLGTLLYVELKEQHNRWYKNKTKIIPKDIELTPRMIANWYMGDGSLDIQKVGKLEQKYYRITLCTECFTLKEHQQLQLQLNERYNWKTYILKFGNTHRLRITRKKDVMDFLKITKQYKSKCFNYKWRALNDKDFMDDKRKINMCEICKKKFETQKFHHQQTVCSKECKNIKNKLTMREYRKKKRRKG